MGMTDPITIFLFSSTTTARWCPSAPSPKKEWGTKWRKTSPSNPPVAKAIMVFRDDGSRVAGTARRMKFGILWSARSRFVLMN
jgi:hypothetical protein